MGHGVWIASHVLFAHPGSFACRHGEDDNEGVSSSGRALLRSTPNHETIQIRTKERPSVEGIERKRSEGYRCVLFKGCVDYQCDVLVSVGDGSDKGVPSRQAQRRSTDQPAALPSKISAGKPRAQNSKQHRNVNKPVEPPQLQRRSRYHPRSPSAALWHCPRTTETRCLPRRDQRPMTPRASSWSSARTWARELLREPMPLGAVPWCSRYVLLVDDSHGAPYGLLTCQQTPRTSGLQAPVMELSGHSGEIFSAKFDPSGNLIASGSMDRSISKVL